MCAVTFNLAGGWGRRGAGRGSGARYCHAPKVKHIFPPPHILHSHTVLLYMCAKTWHSISPLHTHTCTHTITTHQTLPHPLLQATPTATPTPTSGRSGGELCVKVEGVVGSRAGWFEGWGHLPVPQLLPVNGLEEGVCLNVLYAVWAMAQPVLRVTLEQHSEK